MSGLRNCRNGYAFTWPCSVWAAISPVIQQYQEQFQYIVNTAKQNTLWKPGTTTQTENWRNPQDLLNHFTFRAARRCSALYRTTADGAEVGRISAGSVENYCRFPAGIIYASGTTALERVILTQKNLYLWHVVSTRFMIFMKKNDFLSSVRILPNNL
jgi:hypothetical protein